MTPAGCSLASLLVEARQPERRNLGDVRGHVLLEDFSAEVVNRQEAAHLECGREVLDFELVIPVVAVEDKRPRRLCDEISTSPPRAGL